MELHSEKFQLISVDSVAKISTLEGKPNPLKKGMEYLGTTFAGGGTRGHELNRRIGAAKAEFEALSRVWRRSACT